MADALCLPRLTLVKTNEESEPWPEGARNEDGVDGGPEMSVGADCVAGVPMGLSLEVTAAGI